MYIIIPANFRVWSNVLILYFHYSIKHTGTSVFITEMFGHMTMISSLIFGGIFAYHESDSDPHYCLHQLFHK